MGWRGEEKPVKRRTSVEVASRVGDLAHALLLSADCGAAGLRHRRAGGRCQVLEGGVRELQRLGEQGDGRLQRGGGIAREVLQD